MAVYKDEECEFCGKVVPYVSSNSFGVYCKGCLKIMIEECEDSIAEIEIEEGNDSYERFL